MKKLYELDNINLNYSVNGNNIRVLKNINFEIKKNERVALTGESGSGKSLTARAIMGLLPAPHVKVETGKVIFDGKDLVTIKYINYLST